MGAFLQRLSLLSLESLSFAAGEGFRRFNVKFAISNNLIRKHLPILVLQGMHWSCRGSFCETHEFAGPSCFFFTCFAVVDVGGIR